MATQGAAGARTCRHYVTYMWLQKSEREKPSCGETTQHAPTQTKACSTLGRQMMLPPRVAHAVRRSLGRSVRGWRWPSRAQPEGAPGCALPSVRERWCSLHARHAEQCKWDAAAKDLPTEFLDSKNGLLGAQQLVRRKGDDACHADMLSSFDLDTTQGRRDAARLRSSSGGPAEAFLTAIPGGRMTLGNDMFVVSVWHRLGHHVPADVAPPPCKCRAGVAAEAYHAMVCEKVAKMTQMRHDTLANALRLVVSACSCQSAAEPRYRALAGKKGMFEC